MPHIYGRIKTAYGIAPACSNPDRGRDRQGPEISAGISNKLVIFLPRGPQIRTILPKPPFRQAH